MDWFFTVKIVFGAAMNIIVTSPPEFTTKAECLIYAFDTAIERAVWRMPEKVEVTCTASGMAAHVSETEEYLFDPPKPKAAWN